jgi:hypothetical protein
MLPKGYSEVVNQRRTDNTMTTERQIIVYKPPHRYLKIEQHEPHKKLDVLRESGQFLFHY